MRAFWLVVLAACHPKYVPDERPRRVACAVQLRERAVTPGAPIRAQITLANVGAGPVWVGRAIVAANSEWVIDRRNRDARQHDAMVGVTGEIAFSGPSDPRYTLADYVELAPGGRWAVLVDVVGSATSGTVRAGDRDLSDGALVRDALAAPGAHELRLRVSSYPSDQMMGRDWDYDRPWETWCDPVTVDVRTDRY